MIWQRFPWVYLGVTGSTWNTWKHCGIVCRSPPLGNLRMICWLKQNEIRGVWSWDILSTTDVPRSAVEVTRKLHTFWPAIYEHMSIWVNPAWELNADVEYTCTISESRTSEKFWKIVRVARAEQKRNKCSTWKKQLSQYQATVTIKTIKQHGLPLSCKRNQIDKESFSLHIQCHHFQILSALNGDTRWDCFNYFSVLWYFLRCSGGGDSGGGEAKRHGVTWSPGLPIVSDCSDCSIMSHLYHVSCDSHGMFWIFHCPR